MNALGSTDKKTREDTIKKLVGKGNVSDYIKKLDKMSNQNVIKEAQKLGQGNMTKALRQAWPNEMPDSNPYNDYFETINKIMVKPENARPIVIALANVIFKTDLKGWLGLRGIPKDEFKFTLITSLITLSQIISISLFSVSFF